MAESLGSRYVLQEVLGRGAMGQVFTGSIRSTGEPVAIKVLRPELVSDPEVVARFVQERTILMSIADPNVVRVIDLVIEGDTLAIVMELVHGSDLRRLLRTRRTLPPSEALRLTGQLLRGMAVVHAAGIIHRDIKPENVLVDTSGGRPLLKLTDFGVARLSYGASLTKLSGVIGTPEYMAPELAEHNRATPAADVYSAGIVLYEMLCGRTPFAGGHPVAVLRRQADQPPPVIPDVPAELWHLIAWMLAKDPRSRPASAEEASAALAPLERPAAAWPALAPWAGPEAEGAEAWSSTLSVPGAARIGLTGHGGTAPGATVLRHRDHGTVPPTGGLGGPAPWSGGDGGWGPMRTGMAGAPSRRKRQVRTAALAVAVAAVLGLVTTVAMAATHRTAALTPTAGERTTTAPEGVPAGPGSASASDTATQTAAPGSTGPAGGGPASTASGSGTSGSSVSSGSGGTGTSGSGTSGTAKSGTSGTTKSGTGTSGTGQVPGQVTGVTATASNEMVVLNWKAASGTPTGYQVDVSPAPPGQSATQQLGMTTDDQVEGLANGFTYTFTVLATNAKGDGPKSAAITSVPFGQPLTMAAPSAEALAIGATGAGSQSSTTATTLEVNVNVGSSTDNGSQITGYTIYAYKATSSSGPWTEVSSSSAAAISSSMVLHAGEALFTVSNDGSWYEFTATAANAAGTSAQSAPSSPIQVPVAPTTSSSAAAG